MIGDVLCSDWWRCSLCRVSLQCNNPKTKEPKLSAAVRIVPEWSRYDSEIKQLLKRVKDQKPSAKSSASQTQRTSESPLCLVSSCHHITKVLRVWREPLTNIQLFSCVLFRLLLLQAAVVMNFSTCRKGGGRLKPYTCTEISTDWRSRNDQTGPELCRPSWKEIQFFSIYVGWSLYSKGPAGQTLPHKRGNMSSRIWRSGDKEARTPFLLESVSCVIPKMIKLCI